MGVFSRKLEFYGVQAQCKAILGFKVGMWNPAELNIVRVDLGRSSSPGRGQSPVDPSGKNITDSRGNRAYLPVLATEKEGFNSPWQAYHWMS